MIHQIRMSLHLSYLRGRSRINPKNTATLAVGMKLRSASDQSNEESDEPRIPSTKPKKHSDKSKNKSRSRYVSSSSEEDQSSVARHRSSKPSGAQPSGAASDQDLPQHDPDPPYYREVALSDIPSQYAEEVDTFRRILSLPDPRESMPRSSTSVMGLDDEKGRQELRPRGPSSILPLSSVIKDAFDSDVSRARDTRYLASFSTSPQFGIFGAFGRRRDPACLQNGGAPIVSRKSFNFIIMKAIFGRFFSEKCYFI